MSRLIPRNEPAGTAGPERRRLALAWRILGLGLGCVAVYTLLVVVLGHGVVLDAAVVLALALLAAAAVLDIRSTALASDRRRSESETFVRILQALSRSVSPDAIVDAIVGELGAATRADHVAVVRLRPRGDWLDATLVSMLPGSPTSNTILPVALLDPSQTHAVRGGPPVATSRTRQARRLGDSGDRAGPAEGRESSDPGESVQATERVPSTRPASGGGPGPWRPRAALTIHDAESAGLEIAERIGYRLRLDYGLRNTLAAPLRTEERLVGAIVLSRRTTDRWSDADASLLESAARETSAALGRIYTYQDAEVRARTDELTQLPNRRYFDEYCSLLASRRRAADHVGVLAIDVDHFKRFNDRYGHPIGDQVLRAIAGAIQGAVRDEDVPARYGGEEFVVLLRNPAPGVTLEIGERIRNAVRSLELSEVGVPFVTVSVGVATAGGPDESMASIVDRADRALYAAKRAGRDCVIEFADETVGVGR